MATAVESARIGIAKYLVPFVFVYSPALLFEGPLWLTGLSTALAFIGLWGLSMMLEGWYKGPMTPVTRLIVGALSVMSLMPPMVPRFDDVPGYIMPIVGFVGLCIFVVSRHRFIPQVAR